jgi:2-oxoglutarate ferredoxin oxidoreductase subunit beta
MKTQFELKLEHGKPLVFGPPADQSGFVLEGLKPKVVKVKDVAPEKLWVHDEKDKRQGMLLSQLFAPEYPIPLGVLHVEEGQRSYEDVVIAQEEAALKEKGKGDISQLLNSGETWKVS